MADNQRLGNIMNAILLLAVLLGFCVYMIFFSETEPKEEGEFREKLSYMSTFDVPYLPVVDLIFTTCVEGYVYPLEEADNTYFFAKEVTIYYHPFFEFVSSQKVYSFSSQKNTLSHINVVFRDVNRGEYRNYTFLWKDILGLNNDSLDISHDQAIESDKVVFGEDLVFVFRASSLE